LTESEKLIKQSTCSTHETKLNQVAYFTESTHDIDVIVCYVESLDTIYVFTNLSDARSEIEIYG